MTAILIERGLAAVNDSSLAGDSYKVHHFETNAINRLKIKGEIIDSRRRDNYNRIVRDREFSTLGFSSTDSAEEFSTEEGNNQRSTKAFVRKTYHIKLKSITSTNADVLQNCRILIALMFPNFDASPEDFINAFGRLEQNLFEISKKQVHVETQRLYALQKNSSCELKVGTVAAGYYMKNEIGYQTLIYLLIQSALSTVGSISDDSKRDKLAAELAASANEVKKRIILAQHIKASSNRAR